MAVATNRPPMLTRYFKQFQKKGMCYKVESLIKKGINLEEILGRILVGEIWVTYKELWTVAPKL